MTASVIISLYSYVRMFVCEASDGRCHQSPAVRAIGRQKIDNKGAQNKIHGDRWKDRCGSRTRVAFYSVADEKFIRGTVERSMHGGRGRRRRRRRFADSDDDRASECWRRISVGRSLAAPRPRSTRQDRLTDVQLAIFNDRRTTIPRRSAKCCRR